MNDSHIKLMNIEDEMKASYIDYAMSVIVGRAIPDVRDGLKPVHRRIIYTMKELGLLPGKPYKKCARIVGDTMGKYHPHGDAAIYDSLVKMAQTFAIRHPLVDGQGNFGSVDGDPPAAYRYTEARLQKISEELLSDIEKDTVDFRPNFDNSESEPIVLPAKFPNLFANGSTGIAVGMATEIPPHNICELSETCIHLLDNPEAEVEELMHYIQGPDFPTAGRILGKAGIIDAYKTGRGRIIVCGRIEREQIKTRQALVITEIPYQINKSKLIERIADLAKEGKLDGVSDLRDESSRKGIRVVIETKKDAELDILEKKLFHLTELQRSYGIIILALVNNRPAVLPMKKALGYFLDHRKEVIRRRTLFDLNKAEKRAHILEGLLKALDQIDEVISIIRSSKTVEEASGRLILSLDLTEVQARAILEMRLQRLTGLEREKLQSEYNELLKDIEFYKAILSNPQMVVEIIKEELQDVSRVYGGKRKTTIEVDPANLGFDIEDMIEDKQVAITFSEDGYIKRTLCSSYRRQNRGGTGSTGGLCKEDDTFKDLLVATNLETLLFFSNLGKVYSMKAYEISEAQKAAKGKHIRNYLPLMEDEYISSWFNIKDFSDGKHLVMVTRRGKIKKCELKSFQNIRRNGIIGITVKEGDELIKARLSSGDDCVLIFTRKGKAIKVMESEIRAMGRTAGGVIGIRPQKEDEVIEFCICPPDSKELKVLTITENGYSKCTPVDEFSCTHRGGIGVRAHMISKATGNVAGADIVTEEDDILIITALGKIIRIPACKVNTYSRNARGVRAIRLSNEDRVVGFAVNAKIDETSDKEDDMQE